MHLSREVATIGSPDRLVGARHQLNAIRPEGPKQYVVPAFRAFLSLFKRNPDLTVGTNNFRRFAAGFPDDFLREAVSVIDQRLAHGPQHDRFFTKGQLLDVPELPRAFHPIFDFQQQ